MNIISSLVNSLNQHMQNIFDNRKSLQDCESEGREASASGIALSENPYPKGSPKYKAWESGHQNWVW